MVSILKRYPPVLCFFCKKTHKS